MDIDPSICKSLTRAGYFCSNDRIEGMNYCWYHRVNPNTYRVIRSKDHKALKIQYQNKDTKGWINSPYKIFNQ